MSTLFIRFQARDTDRRGIKVGVFGLVNILSKQGLLTEDQERFRRENNAWYDAAYPDPNLVDPTVYDHEANPGAVAWFKAASGPLIERVTGYLEILDAHGVAWERVESTGPGRIIYEDDHQIVVVPACPPVP